jgi:hypothetical protein
MRTAAKNAAMLQPNRRALRRCVNATNTGMARNSMRGASEAPRAFRSISATAVTTPTMTGTTPSIMSRRFADGSTADGR